MNTCFIPYQTPLYIQLFKQMISYKLNMTMTGITNILVKPRHTVIIPSYQNQYIFSKSKSGKI